MRKTLLALALFTAGCSSGDDEGPQVLPPSGPRAGLFVSPMGEPFRGPDDDLIGRWFSGADADRDGALSMAEMRADAVRFFATLDTNGNGEITPVEMARYETQVAPEIQLGRQLPPRESLGRARGGLFGPSRPETGPQLPQGAARYGLLDLPQPVAAADADYNRGVTRAEFEEAAAERFRRLDRDGDGRLTRPELEPAPPPVPAR